MTPARTSATISSRASGPDTASDGDTTSATDTARTSLPATRIRAAEDRPNQPYAGLSKVHRCWAVSTARDPSCSSAKPRPTTASPTSLTGMAPGTGHGQRSRTSWSAPLNSSIVVRQSTRATPRSSVRVWV